jgi:EmrB/QacA subfamily drug resistance transporter
MPATTAPPVTTPSQRRWILVATCLALLAVMVSVSGLNVAQQALAVDLGASQGQLLWIVNGFTVALAATLLPFGALGDRIGRKRVLLIGVGAFATLNLAAAFAGDPTTLLGLRVAMGLSAALIMPATLSTITAAFPAEERARAVGVWTGVAGGGGILGLISSALLIDHASWPWVFAAPIIISLASLAIAVPKVPDTHEAAHGAFDLLGSLFSVLAVGGLVLAIQEGPERGWTSALTLTAAIVGAVGLTAFVRQERRTDHPLLDISVFRDRRLSAGALSLTVMFALLTGMFLVMVQFLQAVIGFSALGSSLALLPMIGAVMTVSPVAPRIADRLGYRTTITGSFGVIAGALLWLAMVPNDPGYLNVVGPIVVLGLALGVAMTPSTTAITESLPADKQGVASALNDTVREFGGAVGVALIGSVMAAGYRSDIASTADALPPALGHAVEEGIGGAFAAAGQLGPDGPRLIADAQHAFLSGWGTAMTLAAGFAAVAAVVAARLIPRDERVEVDDELVDEELALAA